MPSRGIPETPAPRSTRLARDGGGGGRAAADAAVVDQAQALMPALGEQAVDLERVDEAAEEVRDIPIEMPRLVVLQAALVALEQHPRSARPPPPERPTLRPPGRCPAPRGAGPRGAGAPPPRPPPGPPPRRCRSS